MTRSRRTVLFVLPSLAGGGAERAILTLLRHLDRTRFEPHLALVEAAGPYLKEVPADVPVHDLKSSRVRRAIPGIIRLAWSLRPQTAHSTLGELNLAMVLSRPFLPREMRLVLQEVICTSRQLAQVSRHSGKWQWLYRHLYPRADKIICVSDDVLNDLAENFAIPRAKLVRVYYFVDVDRIWQLAALGENPYPDASPQVVAAGRLHKQKGFDLLLDALALVAKTLPSVRLTILGEGPLEAELKAQSEQLGLSSSVRFAGFQSNPYPYFKHADLFVLSSRYEGLPNVALEALALGKPVVASDCPGGVREVLEACPLGHLVPPGDAPALAGAITEVLQSRSESYRLEGVEAFLERFRVERIVREYEEVLSAPGTRQ
ncbi:MAG TPA: glycosyltransferase [Terriglobia bacterium]|nr:glycosyltransferase [Terriglobia bacterium]